MQSPVLHTLNFGYPPVYLLEIIGSLPQGLFEELKAVLTELHTIAEGSSLYSEFIFRLAGWYVGAHNEMLQGSAIDECRLWEGDTEQGLIRIEYNPTTQMRENVIINSRAASLWGMPKDDLVFRFLTYDVPLPCSELDWLRNLVIDAECHFHDVTVHYLRMVIGAGSKVRAMLVCQTVVKTFNPVGRISQAKQLSPTHPQSA